MLSLPRSSTIAARLCVCLCSAVLVVGCTTASRPLPTPIPTYSSEADPGQSNTDTNAWTTPSISVVADGLLGPIGLEVLPDGSLLVAEEGTGGRDDSAGVSLITPDGRVGRFISGLPSSRDSGDLAGVPLVNLAPNGQTLYIGNFGQGHLWSIELPDEQLANGFDLPPTPYMPDELDKAMLPLNNVMLVNPFDMTYTRDGTPVVSDASGNGVAIETPDGTTRFFHRFAKLENPVRPTYPIEAVPTGIIRMDDEYWVTLLGGCPYPDGGGRLVAIDDQRTERTILDGLNMPIDVALGPDGTIWVLEFAAFPPGGDCFSGADYQVESGRLSRLTDDGSLETVIDNLNFPGAVLPMPDGSLYVSEVLPGRVLHITFAASQQRLPTATPTDEAATVAPPVAKRVAIHDVDAALTDVIESQQLQPRPGAEQREGDSPMSELGQLLFFDPILSGDQNISCATCHHPQFAMADRRVLPVGTGGHGLGPERIFLENIDLGAEADAIRRLATVSEEGAQVHNPFIGQFVPRNSPTILNSALLGAQFWDGRVEGYSPTAAIDQAAAQTSAVKTQERVVNDMALTDPLATQALFPVASLHEMAGATFGGLPAQTIRARLLERLRAQPEYVSLFRNAFGSAAESPAEAVTLTRLVAALAAFERRFIFTDAPWDRYVAGEHDALNDAQKRGALLFFGAADPSVTCASCHSGDLFTDQRYHNLLVPQLGPGKGHGYGGREDWGTRPVTFDARDRYAFRTPSLRNAELTAPYFHSGAFATLEDAIRHHADTTGSAMRYDPSAHAIPPELYSSYQPLDPDRQLSSAAPSLQSGMPLTPTDIADLAAFVRALTDPAARDLMAFVPESVPSGLALDPLPASLDNTRSAHTENAVPAATKIDLAVDAPALPSAAFAFTDAANDVGLDFRHGSFAQGVSDDPVAAMGGGLCWLDYDRDGWLDLYLVNSHAEDEVDAWQRGEGLPRNALFRNARGQFEDVSTDSEADLALRGNGCVAADFDNDGWTDLYVTADGPNALLWNNGDGTFSEGAVAAGVAAAEWNSSSAAGDLNGDGLVDLFVTAYIDLDKRIPKPSGAFPQDYYGLADRLYLNQGDGTFAEVTGAAGLAQEERGLGALLTDLDHDGDLDLYVANDGHPNRLYRNDPAVDAAGPGFRFIDVTVDAGVGDTGSGMGVTSGDYDGDGWTDLFITNWERELNALYRSQVGELSDLVYQYSTFRIGISGLGNGMTGWGTHLMDFDHDTDADLLIVNGRVPVTNLATDPELVRFYRNRTADRWDEHARVGHFLEWTGQVGLKELGPLLGRGSAVADFDNDGDLDVAINQIAGPAVLLRNDLSESQADNTDWLMLDPGAVVPGLRATVTLVDGRTITREANAGSSYLASEDPRLHFGLGSVDQPIQVEVVWPDGRLDVLADVAVNQVLRIQ